MSGSFNAFALIQKIADQSLSNQPALESDTFDKDGLLVCGKCGEQKQMFVDLPFKDDTGNPIKRRLKVSRSCKCQRDDEARKSKEKKEQDRMMKVAEVRKLSLMDTKFSTVRFSSLEVTKFNERNLRVCRRYVDKFSDMIESGQGLLLWGNVGTGKSYAAAAIANELMERGTSVIMTSFVEILRAIQGSGSKFDTSKLNSAQLIIFDDLGAERGSDYALEKIYGIIDSRYRKRLPMILTTNLTLEEMKVEPDIRYARIYDRIFETCYPMQFTGQSWRRKVANARFTAMKKLLDDGDDS